MLDQRLETARLILRMVRPADIPALEAMNADPEVMAMSGAGGTLDRAETFKHCCTTLGHWQLKGYGMYVLEEKQTGDFCGSVGLHWRADMQCVELSWILPRAKWSHGYATEAARAVRDHAFAKMDFTELYHFIDPENPRSLRVAEKLGAVRRGEIRTLVDGSERVTDIICVSSRP
ncbi:MAG TPA: GNAT family N-acetyltransferase [Patescibacteria group bacterium]|nr:GNAT family N-acetyltransferase [Patescibacteria group bacterium]